MLYLNKLPWVMGLWPWLAALLLSAVAPAWSGERVNLPTRPDIKTSVFWHATEGATATLLIFPGGGGGFGQVEEAWPSSQNFLVRTSRLWAAQGFNLAIFGRPNDSKALEYEDRIAQPHLQDIQAVLAWVKTKTSTPVWAVGTSRGSISAAFALIHAQDDQLAGGVVTSSVVAFKKAGALPRQDLDRIRLPMLVYHHAKDACDVCQPHEVPAVLAALTHSPVKKLMMVSGGADPSGSPCEAKHWHGFIGMEAQAVSDISAWIKNPVK